MRKAKKASPKESSQQRFPVFTCSFCGKPEEQVRKLICGPGAFICNGCIQLGNDILLAEGDHPQTKITKSKSAGSRNGSAGNAFRERMFEMIVDQAVDSEIWKESCKKAMAVNKIAENQVQAEVQKRLKAAKAKVHEFPGNRELLLEQRIFLALNHISEELSSIKASLHLASPAGKHRNGR
jgi:hypothetical protein